MLKQRLPFNSPFRIGWNMRCFLHTLSCVPSMAAATENAESGKDGTGHRTLLGHMQPEHIADDIRQQHGGQPQVVWQW